MTLKELADRLNAMVAADRNAELNKVEVTINTEDATYTITDIADLDHGVTLEVEINE